MSEFKKFVIIMTVSLMCALGILFIVSAASTVRNRIQVSRQNPLASYEYDGHLFIIRVYPRVGGPIHHPNCPCMEKKPK